MVEYMNIAKMREYTELFSHFDHHSKGYITAESLHLILNSMHIKLNKDDIFQLIK
jgi:Ca2+-binding EF-hand superfamily protein